MEIWSRIFTNKYIQYDTNEEANDINNDSAAYIPYV